MDPVVIAQDGVEKFKEDSFEVIIVDTRYMYMYMYSVHVCCYNCYNIHVHECTHHDMCMCTLISTLQHVEYNVHVHVYVYV